MTGYFPLIPVFLNLNASLKMDKLKFVFAINTGNRRDIVVFSSFSKKKKKEAFSKSLVKFPVKCLKVLKLLGACIMVHCPVYFKPA